jgi:hypothetical protein
MAPTTVAIVRTTIATSGAGTAVVTRGTAKSTSPAGDERVAGGSALGEVRDLGRVDARHHGGTRPSGITRRHPTSWS